MSPHRLHRLKQKLIFSFYLFSPFFQKAWLVPDLLKKSYGNTPAAAIFATNARYKREAFRGSEFAPKILSENGIDVVMKVGHPALNGVCA